MKKICKRLLSAILSAALSVSVLQIPAYAQEIEETESQVTEETKQIIEDNEMVEADENVEVVENKTVGWDGVTMESVCEKEAYRVTFTLTSHWDTGYNINVKVENISETVIENWYLSFDYADVITNIWNAEILEYNENEYIIKNAVWNQDIPADGYVEFGFSTEQSFTGFPKNYELIGSSAEVKKEDYAMEYRVDNDWGSGFTASVTVTNNTDTVLEEWVLEFDFAREITNIWNGVIESREDSHYVIRNAGYNANIGVGESISFGFNGMEGTTEDIPENYSLYSYMLSEENVVQFDVCSDAVENIPEVQIVLYGELVTKPQNPVRENYIFVGWYTDSNYTKEFDFVNTVITKDLTLYARWLDYLCDTDSDGDRVVDSLEEYFGTNPYETDTDGDNLSDYEEVYEVGTHPLVTDTDKNGINDYEDDVDGDGINNGTEVLYGTNVAYEDTDIDDLSDYDELYVYSTNPTLNDTDMDGASDGWEIAKGYDPLVANESFSLSTALGILSEANPVIAKVSLEAYDADVESLNIVKVHPHDNPYITPLVAGYLGDAYDFTIDGKFNEAELTFEYDVNLGTIGENFQPRIYYFNEETKSFEELENQVVENGKVTAITTHFSTYLLLNKVEFDKVWNTEIRTSAQGNNLNVTFVVDLSGSMQGTKLSKTKTAINSFINELDENDEVGLVGFSSTASIWSFLTDDKELVRNNVHLLSARGLTSIYKGIQTGINVFRLSKQTGYRIMIVLTDGYDEPATSYSTHYADLIDLANEFDITIYTIGISTMDEALLTKVAESTGGKYYYASVISELQEKMDELKDDATDYLTDSNEDGISDYHTKLIEEGKIVLSNSSNELKGVNLNYDENGQLTDDCDGDGLKNGEEIKVVTRGDRIYLEMTSHPLRQYSDGDLMDDYTEVQEGGNPLVYEVDRIKVDKLSTDGFYYYETLAGDLRDDEFIKGLINYSAIINGVWNKEELYRDLIIDYYSTYITQDVIDTVTLQEEKDIWYDTLSTFEANVKKYGKVPYETIYNINKLISYVNKVTEAEQLKGDFVNRVSDLVVELNKISEDATEMRFEVAGIPYVKKYADSDLVKKIIGTSQKTMEKCSDGLTFIGGIVDICDNVKSLAKVEANKKVFNENIDVLETISSLGSNRNLCAAADDVTDLLAEEYLDVYSHAISGDAGEMIGELLVSTLASRVGYVAVVVAVRDVMSLLIGSQTDVQQMNRILCYSDICDAYANKFSWKTNLTSNKKYYSCFDIYIEDINRYLINIAQIRILGEQEYYAYEKNDGLFAFIVNKSSSLGELKEDINKTILNVKDLSYALKLDLSSSIKYSAE